VAGKGKMSCPQREMLYQKMNKTTRKRTNTGRNHIKTYKNRKSYYGY